MAARRGPSETTKLIRPESSLLLGSAVGFFDDYDEVRKKVDPDILSKMARVSGSTVSRDVDTGTAVRNPVQVLKSLHEKPDIVPGNVVAGEPTNVKLLDNI